MTAPPTDESFAARWLRRKTESTRQTADTPPRAAAESSPLGGAALSQFSAPPQSPPLGGEEKGEQRRRSDDAAAASGKTDSDMPPLETIDRGGGVGAFLAPGVSDDLRRRALARLFRLPRFNLRDGLDDYDDDFTRFDPPLAGRFAESRKTGDDQTAQTAPDKTAQDPQDPQKEQTAARSEKEKTRPAQAQNRKMESQTDDGEQAAQKPPLVARGADASPAMPPGPTEDGDDA